MPSFMSILARVQESGVIPEKPWGVISPPPRRSRVNMRTGEGSEDHTRKGQIIPQRSQVP